MKQYVIEWDQIQKVLGSSAEDFFEEVNGFIMCLKLCENKTLSFDEVIVLLSEEDLISFFFESGVSDDFSKIIHELKNKLSNCLMDFRKKTSVGLYVGFQFSDAILGYFCLDLLDTKVEDYVLKPNAKEMMDILESLSIHYELKNKKLVGRA